jgi:hypothetical protein
VWHPVGPLPAAVYWRRRLLVLALVLLVVGGLVVLGVWLLSGRTGDDSAGAAAASSSRPMATPALERVVPSFGALATPTSPRPPTAAPVIPRPRASATPAAPAPAAGGPCTDDMLGLAVRAPAAVVVGSKPTLQLVVQNRSRVPCVRALDKNLQEIVLLDARGTRVWGSNDCFPSAGSDTRTLAAGAAVSLPLVWGGLSSEPTCTARRTLPAAGDYVLRGRLDTKISPDTPITLR